MNNSTKIRKKQNLLKCEICEKEFQTNKGLKYHFNIIHDLKKGEYQCNICQKNFIIQSLVTKHVKNVHEKKRYHKCELCGKAFTKAGHLKTHINSVHNGQKYYKCNSCENSFILEDTYLSIQFIMVKKIRNVTHVERHFLKQEI